MANDDIDTQLDYADGEITRDDAESDYKPIYKVYADSKIPVSKRLGQFWHRRQKEGMSHLESSNTKQRWEEVIRYYQNDQGGRGQTRQRLSEVGTGRDNEDFYATENIVFANVSALVPVVYAKNPQVEITANTEDEATNKAKMHEKLVDTLFARRVAPGLNLKPKMRRAVVMTMLTNLSYLELSYTKKEDSSEAVVTEVERLSQKLQEANDIKEIERIEGELQALEEKVNLLSESGPRLRVREPQSVIVDPASEEVDLSDAQYVIMEDFIRTELLRAIYGEYDDQGNWKSIYAPTHVAKNVSGKTNNQGHDEEIQDFSLIDAESDHKKYGYDTEEDYRDACRTRVWMVWDKTTRRVLMFHNDDWCYPIWVWDDPYNLSRFFPVFPLTFYTDPVDRYARSEVMYYLDQQDEINRNNNELARMRHWAMSKVFVNTSLIRDTSALSRFLSGETNDKVHGIPLPDNAKITDAIGTMPAPSTQFEQLFLNDRIYQSIDRMSSVTPVLQNEQFKTNTTNKAIETYESSTQTRLDEKIDAIEEIIGEVGGALMEMCVQFMPSDQVSALIGSRIVQEAGGWDEAMTPAQLHEQYSFRIIGGSTLKPTSKVKKEQAIQLGQILGQYASTTPVVVLVMLKAIERAFNEDFVIEQGEWDMITQSIEQAMQGPAPSPNGGGRPPSEGAGQGAEQTQPQQGGDGVDQAMAALDQIINELDDETRTEFAAAIEQGVPFKDIMRTLLTNMQGQQQPQPQTVQ